METGSGIYLSTATTIKSIGVHFFLVNRQCIYKLIHQNECKWVSHGWNILNRSLNISE